MIDAQNRVHPDDNELAAFIEDALDGPARAQVESHLARCQACRSVLATYSQAVSGMDQAFQPVEVRGKPFRLFGISFNLRPVWAFPIAAGLIAALATTALILSMKEPTAPPQVASTPPSSPSATDQTSLEPAESEKDDVSTPTPPAPKATKPGATPHREPEFPEPDPTLIARRGGRKIVGDKTFRFRTGVWIDTEYDSAGELPLIEVKKGSPDYTQLLAENPDLARYADVGRNVIVVVEGKAYKFTP